MSAVAAIRRAREASFAAGRPSAEELALPLDIEAGRWPNVFRSIMVSLTVGLGLLVIIAAIAPLRELAVAEGQLTPEGSVIPVQHYEGGIVAEILAKPGEIVDADAPLIRLEPTGARADLGQLSARRTSLIATRARLLAQLDETRPNFAALGLADDQRREQEELFRRESEGLAKIRETFAARIAQRTAEIQAAQSEMISLDAQLGANRERLALREKLHKEGYSSRNAFLDAKVTLEQTRARVAQVQGQIESGRSGLAEVRGQLADAESTRRVQWSSDLAKTGAELAEVEQQIAKSRDRVDRLFVRAPSRALVQDMVPKSPGDVLKPGDTVAELVPIGERLVAEVKLRPDDVGYVRAGLQARLKVTAYDPESFGPIQGEVLSVSPTTFKTEKGEPFYKARVGFDRTDVHLGTERHPLLPGMVVRAEILTGEKSVLRYFLKPIFRSFDLAFSER